MSTRIAELAADIRRALANFPALPEAERAALRARAMRDTWDCVTTPMLDIRRGLVRAMRQAHEERRPNVEPIPASLLEAFRKARIMSGGLPHSDERMIDDLRRGFEPSPDVRGAGEQLAELFARQSRAVAIVKRAGKLTPGRTGSAKRFGKSVLSSAAVTAALAGRSPSAWQSQAKTNRRMRRAKGKR